MPQGPLAANVAKNPSNVLVPLKVDAQGNLYVSLNADTAQLSTTATPAGASSHNFAANNAGLQLKTGTGVAAGITVNTAGLTSSVTLYDGTSTAGVKLGTFSTLAVGSLQFNMGFTAGLFAVVAGGTPADVTVSWF